MIYQHSYSCEYPEGCSCGASEANEREAKLNPACVSINQLAKAHERFRTLLMEDEPWPLRDVLAKLVEASEILLHQKNYDGHGWEQISHAVDRAKAALANWPKPLERFSRAATK